MDAFHQSALFVCAMRRSVVGNRRRLLHCCESIQQVVCVSPSLDCVGSPVFLSSRKFHSVRVDPVFVHLPRLRWHVFKMSSRSPGRTSKGCHPVDSNALGQEVRHLDRCLSHPGNRASLLPVPPEGTFKSGPCRDAIAAGDLLFYGHHLDDVPSWRNRYKSRHRR